MAKMSAGLLPYRIGDDGQLLVLLVHPGGPLWINKDAHAWSIPKGEYESGDDPLATAEREFLEELGQPAPEGPRLDLETVRQSGGKLVRAWAVRGDALSVDAVVSNTFEMEWPPRSGQRASFPEVDRAEWMTVGQAEHRLVAAQVEFVRRLAASIPGLPPS